jgi:membrane protein DedA with SNARE-associated domain
VLAGFLVSMKEFNGPLVLSLVIIADLVGDALYYAFGRWGGLYFITRWGRYVGVTQEKVVDLEKHFYEHPGKTLVIGKLSHGIGVVALVAAGMARMNFWKFIWYNFLPSIPKSFVLMVVGFYFGAVYTRIISYLDYLAWIMVILGVAIVAGIILFSRRLRNKTVSNKSL